MPTDPWKYASNTFLVVTDGRTPLMGEIAHDHAPKLAAATGLFAGLATVNTETIAILAQWDAGELALLTAEAAQLSATAAFEDKLASITRKPDIDTNSPLETWDSTIRSQVPYRGTIYQLLLPDGRETLTAGNYQQRLDALQAFGARLLNQATKPTLVSLGTTVTTFWSALNTLRTAQLGKIAAHDTAQTALENLRVSFAWQMFRTAGVAMSIWNTEANAPRVQGLWDLGLIQEAGDARPEVPGLPVWVPGQRRLSVAALPTRATRLEAWRLGPGGAPELLIIGARLATEVVIPAEYTFDAGKLYQLYFKAHNSEGSSEAGPSVSWTAV